jgi:digeranylgeranylglycerophospholipid reductase
MTDATLPNPRGDADILIIGAGFAGLAAARAAAREGARVIVLEAKAEIGGRLHTTGIYVDEAFEVDPPPAHLLRKVERVRLYGPNRAARDLSDAGYAFYTTDTGGVLRWMADEARAAGAEIHVAAPLQAGYQADGKVEVVAGGRRLTGWFLIGADGARSRTAQIFGLGQNRRFLAGVERDYAGLGTMDPNFLHVVLDSKAAPGYVAWGAASPTGAQVGLAVSQGKKPHIDAFLLEAEKLFGLEGVAATEWRAGLIPCGGIVHPWRKGVVALVGDSAGMVSPLTAGGIQTALRYGEKLGAAAGAWFTKKAPPPWYVMQGDLPRFGIRHALRWMMDAPPPNWALQLLVDAGPAATSVAKRMFFSRRG